ncbi:MAG: hypothetical protein FD123_141 [Bacteroidetes bacterium]|nr:MAG: hypothetical protein FD123_141 [Bacteroidota bacterium]
MKLQTLFLAAGLCGVSGFSNVHAQTTSYVPLFGTPPSTLINSELYQNNARIGLGTSNPAAKLHVNSPNINDGIHISQDGNTAAALYLFHSITSQGGLWGMMSYGSGNGQPSNGFGIYDYHAWTDRLFIQGGTIGSNLGHVGIATTNPTERLQIDGGNLLVRGVDNFANIGHTAALYLGDNTNFIRATKLGRIDFGLSGVYTMSICPGGKVLIGNPGIVNVNTGTNYGLYVENGILTSRVRVAVVNSGTWADYVFAPGYKLNPLQEVEKFITANQHLPEVPSACEVEENGVDVVDMQITLLKKIEELTLYMIQQQKTIDQQSKRIAELEQASAE